MNHGCRSACRRWTAVLLFFLISFVGVTAAQAQIPPPPKRSSPVPPAATPDERQEGILRKGSQAVEAAQKARQAALVGKLSPTERSEKELDAFLKAGGLSVAELNRVPKTVVLDESGLPIPTLQATLLRALADFAYVYSEPTLITAAQNRGIDFAQDGLVALISRIVGLDKRARMRAIVDALVGTPYPVIETIQIGMYLSQSQHDTRRYVAYRIAHLPPSPAELGVAELKRWLKSHTPNDPTPANAQGPTGRWNEKMRVYVGPAPERVPALVAGQTFLCLPDEEDFVLTDAVTGKTVPREAYALKILTLQVSEPSRAALYEGENPLRLRFALEGYANPVVWEGDGDLYDLPCLHPLADDKTVRDLRTRYLNKPVWGYGSGVGVDVIIANSREDLSFALGNDPRRGAAVVRRIYRLRSGTPFPLTMGTAPGYSGERRSTFFTHEPLMVMLELPAGVRPPNISFLLASLLPSDSGADEDIDDDKATIDKRPQKRAESLRNEKPPVKIVAYYSTFADAWDFEREYSLVGLEEASQKWPAKYRRAVRQGELVRGMTPEMVVWVMGFPGEYGTKKDLLYTPVKEWRYDDWPPYDQSIYFKNGHYSGSYRMQLP